MRLLNSKRKPECLTHVNHVTGTYITPPGGHPLGSVIVLALTSYKTWQGEAIAMQKSQLLYLTQGFSASSEICPVQQSHMKPRPVFFPCLVI